MNELMQPLTWQDIRFTTKGDKTLYAICLGQPKGDVHMTSLAPLAGRIAEVSLLGSAEKISWKAGTDGLVVHPVSKWPCDYAVTYKIALKE